MPKRVESLSAMRRRVFKQADSANRSARRVIAANNVQSELIIRGLLSPTNKLPKKALSRGAAKKRPG